MIDNDQIDIGQIAHEYESVYRENNLTDSLRDIVLIAEEERRSAIERYEKLPSPKIASLEAYVVYCVRKKIITDIGEKTVEKVSIDSSNPVSSSLAELLESTPKSLLESTAEELFVKLPFSERKKYWKTKEHLFAGFEKKYLKVVDSKNIMAVKKGYRDFVEFNLINDKTPKEAFQFFLDNSDKYIEYCNEQVKEIVVKKDEFFSEYSSAPCYICAQEFLKIKSADELLELMAADYPVLRKNKKKIQVSLGDGAATKYMTETDSFLVTVRKKVNSRHQILDLIHEFSHVILMMKGMSKGADYLGQGRYLQERSVSEIVLRLLKKYSPKIYGAYLGNKLIDLQVALFELEVYRNTQKKLSELSAEIFNKCFLGANQKENPLYMLNTYLLFGPLKSLLYAIVDVETVMSSANKLAPNMKGGEFG